MPGTGSLQPKAADILKSGNDVYSRTGGDTGKSVDYSQVAAGLAGYVPYYIYRQKNTVGNFENVGYAKEGKLGLYNILIMEEKQSILALGAGGISKKFYPAENRLERVPNVSNYEIYIERLDEMIERKRNNFFEEV